jgi:hypothetical protein
MSHTSSIPLVAAALLVFNGGLGAAFAASPFNMAYIEVNDHALSNVACYKRPTDNKPFFDIASIFAANINGTDPNRPEIYFNPQVDRLLNQTTQVKDLQGKGVKVLLTLLGNHQRAGWSGIDQPAAATAFADRIADTVQKYGLDGIDIDDEYSNYDAVYPASTVMIAEALAQNPKFKGKLISKALFQDGDVFTASFNNKKLANFLSLGSEMSYDYPDVRARLGPYVQYGMAKSALAIGLNTSGAPASGAKLASEAIKGGYGGVMVYNVNKNSAAYLSEISKVEFGRAVNVEPNCLR